MSASIDSTFTPTLNQTIRRLCGCAEIGWSSAAGKNWDEYKIRLGTHGPRLSAQDANFYWSSHIPWK